jgi:UDP-N-acetylmuramoyl-L-alanyl-D-glutamate--2,6-diaminopimelate ligase
MLAASGLPLRDGPDIRGLAADSRSVEPGFLFAALPGAKVDGRAFIGDAVARGAAVVLAPEGTEWPPGVPPRPLLTDADPRAALARMAAAFHGMQPAVCVGVTGTNGKTSTVEFLRQFWSVAGRRAASLGTLGLRAPGFAPGASLTTPDPIALHATLAALAKGGVTHAAMEASSHGLDQRRVEGVRFRAAGFSNLTRDHLDYHGTMEAYRAAKLRLFGALLPAGATAAANADMDAVTLAAIRDAARGSGLALLTVGEAGCDVRLLRSAPLPDGQVLRLEAFGTVAEVMLPLPGRFQADNVMLALALAVATGIAPALALSATEVLEGVRGRMERAAVLANGAAVYVDYAHTPDALARLLSALRPHVAPGARLHVLFGAGGDRDPGKRPLMGAAAAEGADAVWITDDNPRSEDPAAIRAAVAAGAPGAIEIGGREAAIAEALSALRAGDVLAVAGKGHEIGQEIAGTVHPFDDAEVVRRLAGGSA